MDKVLTVKVQPQNGRNERQLTAHLATATDMPSHDQAGSHQDRGISHSSGDDVGVPPRPTGRRPITLAGELPLPTWLPRE